MKIACIYNPRFVIYDRRGLVRLTTGDLNCGPCELDMRDCVGTDDV